jgi:UDP-3-O-[3-hydroxymyristoyl] glucosamine N-acyltransferase
VSPTLASIVAALGGTLYGPATQKVEGLAALQSAGPADLSFLNHPKYVAQLQTTQAGCVIVAPASADMAQQRGACIVTDDPYLYYARLSQWWKQQTGQGATPGVHASAVVHALAKVHATASVGPLCVIERGATVGAHTVLKARVTLGEGCSIGERCIVHSGVVIGADGFGFAPDQARGGVWEKIEQLGAVRIGDDVEIGANTCIDRGALSDTLIEDGVKLDNLIQIGHNVKIGKHTAMAGCVGVAGSATIGAHCTVGGGAIVLGHLSIADHVHISAATTVTRSIRQPGNYTGLFPIDDNASWEKNAASLKQLHKLRERVKALESALEKPLTP